MVAVGLDVDKSHEGGTGPEYREYGQNTKALNMLQAHAAMRGVQRNTRSASPTWVAKWK